MTDERADQHIDELLEECLQVPESAWLERLDELCKGYPDLAGELCRRFEALVAMELVGDSESAIGDGAELGPFRLLQRLGSGAMGEVFLALDRRTERRVALKLPYAPVAAADGSAGRFDREIEAACRLEHPNLCELYEADEIEGRPYLSMRYVRGRSLAQWIDDQRAAALVPGTPSEDERILRVCDWFAQLARGLEYAHTSHVVHRDIKPSNIVLDQARAAPVIVDFGLAHLVGAEVRLTRTGEPVGTPLYMAPEIAQGEKEIDGRADVYSLGVTLFECLTLEPAFRARSPEQLYAHKAHSDPPSARRLRRSVPADLARILVQAMDREPRYRHRTAGALAEDLEAVLAGKRPRHTRRPPPLVQARRWAQRHPVTAGVGAALVLGLVVSLILVVQLRASLRRSALSELHLAAQTELERDQGLALWCALEAYSIEQDATTRGTLYSTLARHRELWRYDPDETVYEAQWTTGPDGPILIRMLTGLSLVQRDHEETGLEGAAGVRFVRAHAHGVTAIVGEKGALAVRSWTLEGQPTGLVPLPEDAEFGYGEPLPILVKNRVVLCRDDTEPTVYRVDLAAGTLDSWRLGDLPIRSMALAPDDHTVYFAEGGSGDRDRRVWVGSLDAPPEPLAATVHDRPILMCHVTPAGALVTGSMGKVVLWDAQQQTPGREVELAPDALPMAIDARAQHLISWRLGRGRASLFEFWDLNDEQVTSSVPVLVRQSVCALSPDGRLASLVLAGSRLWLGTAGGDAFAAVPEVATPGLMRFSEDSSRVLTSSVTAGVRILDCGTTDFCILPHDYFVRDVDWSPDGLKVVTAGLDKRLRVWTHEGQLVDEFPGEGDRCFYRVSFVDDQTILAGYTDVDEEERRVLWLETVRLDDGKRSRFSAPGVVMEEWKSEVPTFELTPSGRSVVNVMRNNRTVWLLEPTEGADDYTVMWSTKTLPGQGEGNLGNDVTFADGGSKIVVGDHYGWVFVLDPETGELEDRWRAHVGVVGEIVAVPGGIVTTGHDSMVHRWRFGSHEPVRTYVGHRDGIVAADVHGKLLATGSHDSTIRLWDLDTGELLAIIEAHAAMISSLCFSPDGRRLASTSLDGTARVWPMDFDALVGIAEARLREFMERDRERFSLEAVRAR